MRPGAVIAAAGIPGGFRAYEKLKNTDRNAMLRRMIRTFQRAGVEDIVIVTGYRAQETEKGLAKMGAAFLRYEDYETAQMLDFAVRGFRYLKNSDRIFFCPADVPLFTEDTLKAMMECATTRQARVVIPVYKERASGPDRYRTDGSNCSLQRGAGAERSARCFRGGNMSASGRG